MNDEDDDVGGYDSTLIYIQSDLPTTTTIKIGGDFRLSAGILSFGWIGKQKGDSLLLVTPYRYEMCFKKRT